MGRRSASEYDPFNPEPRGIRCPSCQASKMTCKEEGTERTCPKCGRVERWLQPSRKLLGDRRHQRLLARQRKKFGELEMVLFQWIADPEPAEKTDPD